MFVSTARVPEVTTVPLVTCTGTLDDTSVALFNISVVLLSTARGLTDDFMSTARELTNGFVSTARELTNDFVSID